MSCRRIAVIPGDGIGPEVISQGIALLDEMNEARQMNLERVYFDWGAEKWLKEGIGLPKDALRELSSRFDAIYFGALGDPRIPDMAHGREILLGMRMGLDLYVNLRPVSLIDDRLGVLKNKTKEQINFVVFRENTEDLYVSIGGNFKKGTAQEVAMDQSIHTRLGVERIIRYAFEYAAKNDRRRVTLGDKSNAIRFSGSLWQNTFKEVAKEYPSIETNHLFVDVMAMEMVLHPERFDVIVTSNLFGDILTDLGAGIAGGLGLAASANLHPGKIGLFEPVHGSAPDIGGKNEANPLAAFLTLAMLLSYLTFPKEAKAIEASVRKSIQEGVCTKDLGGSSSTQEVGSFVHRQVMEFLR